MNHIRIQVEGGIDVCGGCPVNVWGVHPAWELAHPGESSDQTDRRK